MALDEIMDINKFSEKSRIFIDSKKFLDLVPGLNHLSPWSRESLGDCENVFLKNFQDASSDFNEHYLMFLGEGLRRSFRGVWACGDILDPGNNNLRNIVGIYYPESKHFDAVSSMLDEAIRVSSGEVWSTYFMVTDYLTSMPQEA
ncbi:MAG: hypothetical protein Q3965_01895 [Rothia sp. (in: high G+C Gram-positive bacteria)]|nr:hypothetical protein [Rothia sp. (in: high G+C Gram-positive bacteria)]